MLLQNLQLVVAKRYESKEQRRRTNRPMCSVVLDEFAPFLYHLLVSNQMLLELHESCAYLCDGWHESCNAIASLSVERVRARDATSIQAGEDITGLHAKLCKNGIRQIGFRLDLPQSRESELKTCNVHQPPGYDRRFGSVTLHDAQLLTMKQLKACRVCKSQSAYFQRKAISHQRSWRVSKVA